MNREEDIRRFYALLENLEEKICGKRELNNCDGRMDWPERGVYLFFSNRETLPNDNRLRVTRVGTHAVSEGSQTTLWDRLRQHRGTFSGKYVDGGNHRGSVFRLRVGEAIIEKEDLHEKYSDWGKNLSAGPEVREKEHPLEKRVSQYIRDLPFLWLKVKGESTSNNPRSYLESNSIALVSNFEKSLIYPRANDWLGHSSPEEKISRSGLWNVKHVDEIYEPSFLDFLNKIIQQ